MSEMTPLPPPLEVRVERPGESDRAPDWAAWKVTFDRSGTRTVEFLTKAELGVLYEAVERAEYGYTIGKGRQ